MLLQVRVVHVCACTYVYACCVPVSGVEGFLHAVPMVDIDVDIHHTRVILQEFQDTKDDVVDIAETGRLALLSVVQTSGLSESECKCRELSA